jgi:steroid 5-alpha reductase family enzyme
MFANSTIGEMTLWTGMATVAAGVMTTSPALAQMGLSAGTGGLIGAMAMAYVSPAFVTFLLTKVSGIPMSETKYDKRFENDAGYQKWKKETPVLFPKFW